MVLDAKDWACSHAISMDRHIWRFENKKEKCFFFDNKTKEWVVNPSALNEAIKEFVKDVNERKEKMIEILKEGRMCEKVRRENESYRKMVLGIGKDPMPELVFKRADKKQ